MFNLLLSILITAAIDSTELWIGDQTQLHLETVATQTDHVEFPVYGETLINGIEIVERTTIDTLTAKDGQITLHQDLTLTSFKDSLFYIAPLPFVVNGDTLYSQPMTLNVVQPFVMDSTDNAITDIKNIMRAPIWWWGIIRWVLLSIAIIGLGIAIFFLIRFLQKRKKQTAITKEEQELLRPAEEVALEKLNKLKEEKIWQIGREKDYHSDLTAIIREYIARRFDVRSQEKTSEETLTHMKPLLKEQKALFESLRKMLQLADLVKFAKWKPTPEENENSLHAAYEFVKQTTPEPTQEITDMES